MPKDKNGHLEIISFHYAVYPMSVKMQLHRLIFLSRNYNLSSQDMNVCFVHAGRDVTTGKI